MATISTPDLFKAYLAYFGRPPDLTGLAFFSNKTEAEVVAAFSASPESKILLASQGSIPEQVNAIYMNLFNRPAEFGGPNSATYWVNKITQGELTVAQAAMVIAGAAVGTDAQTVQAKVNASVAFVAQVQADNLAASYSGLESAQDGRDFLHTVDYQHIPTPAQIEAAVVVATTAYVPPPPPAATYEVIASADTVNEGQTVVFTISTTNVAEFTLLSYTLSGITGADLASGSMAGSVQVDASGQATISVALKADSLTEGTETLTLSIGAGLASASVQVLDTSVTPEPPPVVGTTQVATTGIDILHGTSADDSFVATNTTLQNGDRFYGEAGTDQLDVAISGSASSFLDGFKTSSVEVIRVNNLSDAQTTLNVAAVGYDTKDGMVEMFSDDAWGDVRFLDIQNISKTKLHVKDTSDSTYFGYDTGNSAAAGFDNGASGAEGDAVDLTVSEMMATNRPGSNWYTGFKPGATTSDGARAGVDGAVVMLYNSDNGTDSYVDKITLHSDITGTPSETKKNTMQLYTTDQLPTGEDMGQDLDTLVIDGRADLEITNTLAANIRLVDASGHVDATSDARADLILDLSNSSDGVLFADQNQWWTDDANGDGYVSGDAGDLRSGIVGTLTVLGSQGDDLITTGITHNNKNVVLGTGNDTLVAAGWITSSDSSSAQIVDGGSSGTQLRHPSFEILWGGEATVDGGAGNDVVVTGNLNDKVSTGEGNDIVIDGGSTSLNTRNTNYFHGEPLNRYDTESDVQRNGNWFDLGAGNDQLTVYGALNLLGDSASLVERQAVLGSNDTVTAGEGNDNVLIYGSAIDATIQANQGNVWDPVTSVVDLGAGNDTLSVGDMLKDGGWFGSRGSVSVMGGEGNDLISISRDGDQTVHAGAGADVVKIYQDQNEFSTNHYDSTARDGNHKIWLDAGDDSLLITGRSEVAVAGKTTDIDAGTGNDYVEIEQDHRLNVKLGEGNDTLKMRAQDLQSNDTIQGGDNYLTDTVNGYDTIVLTNESDTEFYGEVRDSETRHVFAIEQFNLLDSNIRLHITDNLVDTALDKKIIVDTTGSERGDFPIDLRTSGAIPETQGMLWSDWVKYYNSEIPGLNHVRTPDPAHPNDRSFDQMFATYEEPIPHQTVDLTQLNTVDYTFELRGGSLQDIVVVDEDALSADLYLDFDTTADNNEGWSKTDTLQVVDGAAIRAADLEHVDDLEIIDLVASSNIAQTWTVELNNHVINQPTAREPLIIRVDPNVPAGSKVYVVFSENNTNLAENDVIIERNSNVQVFIVTDQGALDYDAYLAHEDQYNTDVAAWHFNGSPFKVMVVTSQYFTDNADNLQGIENHGDLFIAQTLDQVQAGDQVDGKSGTDTVELRFAVANQVEALSEQLAYAGLHSIEVLTFNTENQVMFDTLSYGWDDADGWAENLATIVSGQSSDTLLDIERAGMFFRLEAGNDKIDFTAEYLDKRQDMTATIDGGSGNDSVAGSFADDIFLLGSVETVRGHAGNDEFTYSHSYGMDGNDGNIYVDGGSGEDSLHLDDDGSNGVVTAYDVETIRGGRGVDVIDAHMTEDDNMYVYGDGGSDSITAQSTSDSYVYVSGGASDDWLSANNANGSVWVDGDGGNDTIIAGWGTPNYVTVMGGTGDDNITARANDGVWIEGGSDGNDTVIHGDVINVTVGGAFTYNVTLARGTIWGDNASEGDTVVAGDDDVINAEFNDVGAVHGGGGNDTITVTSDGDSGTGAVTSIFGGYGSDVISVGTVDPTHTLVNPDAKTLINAGGDSSNDTINLQYVNSNVDTIVFGNIVYAADQTTQTTNTQGLDAINGFNWEGGSGPDTAKPGQEDVMDFSDFLTGASINMGYADWKPSGPSGVGDVVLAGGLGGGRANVVVLATDNTYDLADLANDIYLVGSTTNSGIWAQDGSRFVVITAQDPNQNDGLVGFKDYNVYFVQDVDTEAGSAVWRVDLVAQVDAASYSGAITGLNSAQFINT